MAAVTEKVNKTPWIPKRVSQHTCFLQASEAPVIDLKPGQVEVERKGFYTKERRIPEGNYLQDGNHSLYHTQISTTTNPDHYRNPQKPLIPAALRVQMGLEKSAAEVEVEVPAAEEAAPAAEGEDLGATLKDGEAAAEGEAAAADAPVEEVAAPPTVSAPATSSKPKGSTSSAHWGSTYKAQYDSSKDDLIEACKTYKRLRGPPFAIMHPPTCVSDERSQSFYQTEFGTNGSNPMERLLLPTYESAGVSAETHEKYYAGPVASRIIDNKAISDNDVFRKAGDAMGTTAISGATLAALGAVAKPVVVKTDLTKGTTKATGHMPGYMGFIPGTTNNPKVSILESGLAPRQPNTGLSDIYHQNIPGYTGHNPVTAINDRGPRQITKMSTFGRDYGSYLGWEKTIK